MARYIITLLACFALTPVAWSQDATDDDTNAEETTEAAEPDAAEVDDSDLDEQIYEDVDDDFRPSEEISTDQSIAFPTDI